MYKLFFFLSVFFILEGEDWPLFSWVRNTLHSSELHQLIINAAHQEEDFHIWKRLYICSLRFIIIKH